MLERFVCVFHCVSRVCASGVFTVCCVDYLSFVLVCAKSSEHGKVIVVHVSSSDHPDLLLSVSGWLCCVYMYLPI